MRKEIFNDRTEDGIRHVADVHVITPDSDKENLPNSYHYHNCFEILIVLRGEVRIMANYMLKELSEGSIVMLRNNLPHEIVGCSETYRVVIIHIPQIILLWDMDRIPELCREHTFVKNSRFGYLFTSPVLYRKVLTLSRKIAAEEGFMRISYLYKMLHIMSEGEIAGHLVENWDTDGTPHLKSKPGENSIDRTFRYLYEHYTEDRTLDEIADYANQNKTALCRAFKKATGYSVFQFINRLRVERACKLLRNTDESITSIACKVGYNTFSHFNTQFHSVMGISPSEYRKEIE